MIRSYNSGFGGESLRTHALTPKSGNLYGDSQRPNQDLWEYQGFYTKIWDIHSF
jgi:hypothetical protein